MRIRILRMIITKQGGFNPGEVTEVDKITGERWCSAGLACEDKSQDGAKETKAKPSSKTVPPVAEMTPEWASGTGEEGPAAEPGEVASAAGGGEEEPKTEAEDS